MDFPEKKLIKSFFQSKINEAAADYEMTCVHPNFFQNQLGTSIDEKNS